MIKSFRRRGLQELFENGQSRKIDSVFHDRLLRRLDVLDSAHRPEDMDLPGFRFHALRGKPKRYAVSVSGYWRLTFEWDGQNAVRVDFEDYH